jgi:hypothetical protein
MMNRFLLPVFALFSIGAAAAELNALTPEEKAAGWKLLFDGKDPAANFRGYNKDKLPDGWVAEGGALVRKKGGGDIVTKEKYENFELSIDWKISEGGNSGIMYRVQESKDPPWYTGPEVQLQDNIKGHDPQKAGWLYQFYQTDKDTTKPVGEWNNIRIILDHNKCQHWMNGTKYVEYEIGSPDWNERFSKSKFAKMEGFAKTPLGHICLQDHGNEVAFRNIKIRVIK